MEHTTTPDPFEATCIDFNRDPQLLDLAYGKMVFYNPYSGPKYTTTFHYEKTSLRSKYYTLVPAFTYYTIPIELTDTVNFLPSDDPNITNLKDSHYDCEKQDNFRHFNLNVTQCTEALSNIQHANVKALVYFCAEAKFGKVFKCEAYAKKKRKICFQGSLKYRRVDRTVWKHNTMPLFDNLDPLDYKNLIRHLNGTNNKRLNNRNYNNFITFAEVH